MTAAKPQLSLIHVLSRANPVLPITDLAKSTLLPQSQIDGLSSVVAQSLLSRVQKLAQTSGAGANDILRDLDAWQAEPLLQQGHEQASAFGASFALSLFGDAALVKSWEQRQAHSAQVDKNKAAHLVPYLVTWSLASTCALIDLSNEQNSDRIETANLETATWFASLTSRFGWDKAERQAGQPSGLQSGAQACVIDCLLDGDLSVLALNPLDADKAAVEKEAESQDDPTFA